MLVYDPRCMYADVCVLLFSYVHLIYLGHRSFFCLQVILPMQKSMMKLLPLHTTLGVPLLILVSERR